MDFIFVYAVRTHKICIEGYGWWRGIGRKKKVNDILKSWITNSARRKMKGEQRLKEKDKERERERKRSEKVDKKGDVERENRE